MSNRVHGIMLLVGAGLALPNQASDPENGAASSAPTIQILREGRSKQRPYLALRTLTRAQQAAPLPRTSHPALLSLISQRLDRIQEGRLAGRVVAEEHPHQG